MKRRLNKRRTYDDENTSIKSNKKRQLEDGPVEILQVEINSIEDLIKLGMMYDPNDEKRYNIDLKKLSEMVGPLQELERMIGMKKVKKQLLLQILYFLQDFHRGSIDMLHTVIQGPPGVGKTELAKIISRIYLKMGILKSDAFIIAKRSDLIAKYLGQTADKTQKVIDSAWGGVLLIDEAYSLGDGEGKDSFSKECLDTLNQNLTENKGNFMCVIVGYADALENCFFAVNPGLSRRFNFRYTIDTYNFTEMRDILFKKIREDSWFVKEPIEENIPISFFQENKDYFQNFGGDIENLFFNIKIQHSRRVFILSATERRIITIEDLRAGFLTFKENVKVEQKNYAYEHLYL